MQIGEAHFTASTLTLEFTDGRRHTLTQAQGALLLMLGAERGRVVSRSSLRGALKQVGANERKLEQEMRALGALMGPAWRYLLEEVGSEGYLLHSGMHPMGRLFARPVRDLPWLHCFALACIGMLAVFLVLLIWS